MRKLTLHIISLGLFITIVMATSAQQNSVRSHYFIQEYLLNPAFTGSKNYNPLYFSYRKQWSGFENSPEFFSASGYYVLDHSSNIAGSIYNYAQGGAFNQTVAQLNYSHDFHFSQWAHITIGGGLIMDQFTADFTGIDVLDPNDPALLASNRGKLAMDGALGVKYFLQRFKLGLSVANLFESSVSNSENTLQNNLAREFRFITQYDFLIDSILHVEPLIVARYLPESRIGQIDFSVLANYNDAYTLGLTYRTNASLSLVGGIQYKKFYFLYSHEVNVTGIGSAVGTNNEITAGYRFPLHPSKIYIDNDLDGIVNKKDSCPDQFGTKKHEGCPLDEWALMLSSRLDTIADTLAIDDSLIFKLEKLEGQNLDLVKLFLVDENGNVIYQALKTDQGFLFKYLPDMGTYQFRLDNLPDSLSFMAMELNVNLNDSTQTILAILNKKNGYFEFNFLKEYNQGPPKLLMINDDGQVMAVGIKDGQVFKFNIIPDNTDNVRYKLVGNTQSDTISEIEIVMRTAEKVKNLKLIYSLIDDSFQEEMISFIEEGEVDDLLLKIENSKSNAKIVNALKVITEDKSSILSEYQTSKLAYYYTIQIGAYKTQMNDQTYDKINDAFGDQFQIFHDRNLEMDKYVIGRFKTLEDAKEVNIKLLGQGFENCFPVGVKEEQVVPANTIFE